jgi:hypothetical protein
MRTTQITLGEIIDATYADLMETYGDHELALAGALATADEVLARFAPGRRRPTTETLPLPSGAPFATSRARRPTNPLS